ncbi:uncharacterized protein DUF664 [Mumia flava]|uniref:Uncharacterized protein DUF664 n=1 Tax=Mumia flava TaxID=1348852 RepID=A0A0B2B191_9ACTN|nr:DinB family protein [Mumia flava]PJJ48154.1 uncharacterized protein DUF664 [Mumia flava]
MRRVPFTGDEKQSLYVALDRHRDALLWKLEGLSEDDLRRSVVPSGTSLLGMLKHLASVEYNWFCGTFGRESLEVPYSDDDWDSDWRIEPWETTEGVLEYYAMARRDADAVIDELDLTDTGTAWYGPTVTLRWVLIHMVEEVCRHAGHADIIRELLDGRTGSFEDYPG